MSDRVGIYVGTYSGRKFWPTDPRADEVELIDLAHHLSMKCRYGGAARRFYSVAEHSVIVSQYVPEAFAREALLHDAAEAYVGDMVRPLKGLPEMRAFGEIEDRIYPVIMERFGVVSTAASRDAIAEIDNRIMADEVPALMTDVRIYRTGTLVPLGATIAALDPSAARSVFLRQFMDLFGG